MHVAVNYGQEYIVQLMLEWMGSSGENTINMQNEVSMQYFLSLADMGSEANVCVSRID